MKRRPIPDDERRARLVARHHLAKTAADPVAAVRGVVAMHSSDPLTPYLGVWARVPGVSIADIERTLFEDRALWRLHAMRRTLFVVPSDEATMFHAAAGSDVSRTERKRLEAWLGAEIGTGKAKRWVETVEPAVIRALGDGGELKTQDLCARVPELGLEVTLGAGKWTARSPIGSRLLFLLAMEGRIARTRPAGTWRSSQYHWMSTAAFTRGEPSGGAFGTLDPTAARADLARRYLAQHGPATAMDVRWWTGWTVKQLTAALAEVRAVIVQLDDGKEGYVMPSDVEQPGTPTGAMNDVSHVALLPVLDPTVMGWKERAFYLGDHSRRLFDVNGNAGPTVWVDGRIVGGWAVRGADGAGEVVYRLLEDVGSEAVRRIDVEAAALTTWLGGAAPIPRFRTPLERELAE